MNKVLKKYVWSDNNKYYVGTPSDDDFDLIKKFTHNDIKKEDIFVYPVRLADNLIDREFECFTEKSLEDMAKGFVGTVGINSHDWDNSECHSRIYKTSVEHKNDSATNEVFIVGYAYTLNNEKNKDFTDSIKYGIRKSTSVGVHVVNRICSICGENIDTCKHDVGKSYDGKTCCVLLDGVDDCYEFSFVNVPAEKSAGVLKKYKGELKKMDINTLLIDLVSKYNVPKDDIAEIKSCLKSVSTMSDAKIKALQDTIASKDARIKELEQERDDTKIASCLSKVYDDFKPKNAKAREIADSVAKEILKLSSEGIDGEDELRELFNGEYDFLFDNHDAVKAEVAEDNKIEEKEDELLEGKEDEEDDENAKEVLKSLGFTLSSEKKAINSTRILGRKLS